MPKRFLALDIDGTIWPDDLEEAWIEQLVHDGELSSHVLQQNRALLGGHLVGEFDQQEYLRFFLGITRGCQLTTISDLAERVFQNKVKPRIYIEAVSTVERWRSHGAFIFLLTAANHIAAMPIGRFLGVDAVVATELEIDSQGYLSGALTGTYCYGPGKVTKAEHLCERMGLRLIDGTYYADSTSDVPMFEAVGEAVVVNPSNANLEKMARQRDWKIVRWNQFLAINQTESGSSL